MNSNVEKMRAFIIKFLYLAIWVAIIYCTLKYAMPLFMPFVIAFIIAFLLKPLINFIHKKTHLSRRVVAVILLILLYAGIGTLLTLLSIRGVVYLSGWFKELPAFYSNTIEPAFSNISQWFDGFISRLDPAMISFFNTAGESISNSLSSLISAISSGAIGLLSGIAGKVPLIVVAFVLTIIASFFFVVDYYRITGFIRKQLSESAFQKIQVVRNFVVNVLFKFARAYFILLSITFVEVSIGLLILGVEHPFLIAFLTAIVDILPVFGTGTVMIPWAVYCLFTGDIFRGIGLLVVYGIITVIRQVLEPRVVGRQIGLYPLLTLVTMFIGARLFGFWGMFGFPITLTVLIHLNRSGEIKLFRE